MSLYDHGKEHKVYLFVGVLSYSRYTYIEPCLDMKMNTWLKCNVNMLNFFKGAPLQIICDNLKTGVTKHPREGDIILNTEYERLGNHYHAAIMPARVKKPKDKPNAENAAGDCCTFIIARLRNRSFSSFTELCMAVAIKNKEYNERPFSKADGSRLEMFRQEQEFLQPLPAFAFDVSQWRYKVKVAPNSHIAYKKNFYSCPHSYIGHEVSVCESFNDNMVRIYDNDLLLASHPRFPETASNRYSTHAEDLPKQSHYVEFDKERIEKWAKSIGNNTAQVIKRIFSSCDFEQQGYNPCLSVLRLSSKYGKSELERACEIAKEQGVKRAIMLPVSGAFHSPLMQTAADKMAEIIANTKFADPKVKVVSNLTAREYSDTTEIKDLLVKQITNTVKWQESVVYMHQAGVAKFIECGFGNVLSGLIKKTLSDVEALTAEDLIKSYAQAV